MKVAIIGSRTFNDYNYLSSCLQKLFPEPFEVVSGGAKGADALSERYAKDNGLPTIIFKPDWDLHGKAAGFIRNKDIINAADKVVAFWDGKSKGTKHSIDLAVNQGKEVIIFIKQ